MLVCFGDRVVGPCPACGDENASSRWTVGDRLFRTTDERFRLSQCSSCGVFFLDPPPAPEELARYYPESFWRGDDGDGEGRADLRGRLTKWYRRLILRDQARFVGQIIEEQKRSGRWRGLLDIGCGDGSTMASFECEPAVGLDASASAVRHVASRGLTAVRAFPDAIPFAPGSFSVVTMFHFLEHVRPAAPHLASARRLLCDGGELVVQVPNSKSWGAGLLGRRWQGFDPPRHLINYNPSALQRTLEEQGFRVVSENHFCLRDNPATLAMSLAPRLYPPARGESAGGVPALAGDITYLALTLAAIPFAYLESAMGRGESVMVRCRLRDESTDTAHSA